MTHPKETNAPETLDEAELDTITGGFEAWPSKVTGPQLKSDSNEMTGQHTTAGDMKLQPKGAAAGPLLARALCDNEVVE